MPSPWAVRSAWNGSGLWCKSSLSQAIATLLKISGSKGIEVGTGPLLDGRTGSTTIINSDGVLQTLPAGMLAYEGGRYVNLNDGVMRNSGVLGWQAFDTDTAGDPLLTTPLLRIESADTNFAPNAANMIGSGWSSDTVSGTTRSLTSNAVESTHTKGFAYTLTKDLHYTISFDVTNEGANYVQILINGSNTSRFARAIFDLTTGECTLTEVINNATITKTYCKYLKPNQYRIAITLVTTALTGAFAGSYVQLVNSPTAARTDLFGNVSFLGNTNLKIKIDNPQITQSRYLSSYITTVTTQASRLPDELTLPVSGNIPSLPFELIYGIERDAPMPISADTWISIGEINVLYTDSVGTLRCTDGDNVATLPLGLSANTANCIIKLVFDYQTMRIECSLDNGATWQIGDTVMYNQALKTASGLISITSSNAPIYIKNLEIKTIQSTPPSGFVVNSITSLLAKMATNRVDIVMIGDSNQLHSGYGWDAGLQAALMSKGYQMYATGLISCYESQSLGGGAGFNFSFNAATTDTDFVSSGAPATLNSYLSSVNPHNYAYLQTGNYNQGNNSGLIVLDGGLDTSKSLTFDLHYGTFDSGAGVFKQSVRLGVSPFNQITSGPAINTNTGSHTLKRSSITISADASRATKPLQVQLTASDQAIVAPFFGLWMRASDSSRINGFSAHTLHGQGGDSMRDMASAVGGMSDTGLTYYFEEIRRLQGVYKTVAVFINTGVNDQNEGLPSMINALTPGKSAAAYVDNFTYLYNKIRNIWIINNWDTNELVFFVIPSHPTSTPDDSDLIDYRNAMQANLSNFNNVHLFDFNSVTNESEMIANNWYLDNVLDHFHLTQAGYLELSKKLLV